MMFAVHDGLENFENPSLTADDDERELCVQLALKMAACLPNDPELGKSILGMAETVYAVMTDLRQGRGRALAG